MPGVPTPGYAFILAARDLAPADTAELDPAQVLALVTESGGPTSHTAILARSLGIPAVVGCAGVLDIADGVPVTVDGALGLVEVGVDEATINSVREAETRRRRRLSTVTGPGRTADGVPVALLANVGAASDPIEGAEGIGLFRTELLYLDRSEAPSLDEQVEAYTAVFTTMPGRKVVVRTLDAGADKPLPFLRSGDEPNPALGVRGPRIARRNPDVLRTQLDAIATAAKACTAEVWVMAPMVATVAEAADFVARCRTAGLAHAGVMIEVPAAALRVEAILAVTDFIIIGIVHVLGLWTRLDPVLARKPSQQPSTARPIQRRPRSGPHPNEIATERVLIRRALRVEARAFAAVDPALARELGIGRPDIDKAYDDGGLVDLNHAPPEVIATLPDLTRDDADAVVAARLRAGPFLSTDDLIVRADLDPGKRSGIDEYACYLEL